MAIDLIDVGSAEDDGTGDSGRAGGIKINAMFTELYNVTDNLVIGTDVQAWDADLDIWATKDETDYLLVDGSRDSTGGQRFTGHIGIGSIGTVSNNSIIAASDNITDNVSPNYGINCNTTLVGTVALGGSVIGVNGLSTYTATPSGTSYSLSCAGLNFLAVQSSTNVLGSLTGASTGIKIDTTGANVITATGLKVTSEIVNPSVRPLYAYGIDIEAVDSVAAGGNTYAGLRIAKASNATNNYGVMLNDDGLGADIVFGAGQDANIYYDNTNLVINPKLVGSGYLDVKAPVHAEAFVSDFIHLDQPTSQNIGGVVATTTLIAWDTTAIHSSATNGDLTHSTSTNPSRITANTAGRYSVTAKINSDNTGGGRFFPEIYVAKNGSPVTRTKASTYQRGLSYSEIMSMTVVTEIQLDATDYIEIETNVQATDATYTVNTVTAECELIIRRIG